MIEKRVFIRSFFSKSLMKRPNKLESMPLANIFSSVKYLRVRSEPTRVENLLSVSIKDRLPAITRKKTRTGWKGLPGTYALAYFASSPVTKNIVIQLTPKIKVLKNFFIPDEEAK